MHSQYLILPTHNRSSGPIKSRSWNRGKHGDRNYRIRIRRIAVGQGHGHGIFYGSGEIKITMPSVGFPGTQNRGDGSGTKRFSGRIHGYRINIRKGIFYADLKASRLIGFPVKTAKQNITTPANQADIGNLHRAWKYKIF